VRFSQLEISTFRNLTSVALDLAPGLNYFYGENGAGKTALLEAVHLLCRGRSFRTQKVQNLIQRDADQLIVRGIIQDELRGSISLAVRKDRRARTELKVDGLAERHLSRVAHLTPLQVMLPDIAELVFGGPGLRRSWLDWGMFHVKHDYIDRLRSYLRAVKQRNTLIRDQSGRSLMTPWNMEVFRLSEAVTEDRQWYLALLLPHFRSVLGRLAPEIEIDIDYQRGWPTGESLDKLLGESHPRELKYGATLWGPHRADVQVRVGGSQAASILSRGQGKLVASALQIAQAALLAEHEQRTTVFLIDDAGAELDVSHNERFFVLLQEIGGQILATTTREPGADDSVAQIASRQKRKEATSAPESRVFHVEHGKVGRREESE
jgi:DNA replication and repair protein RecF